MTGQRESRSTLDAGRALDALVAEKVMGWRCVAEGQYGRLLIIGKTAQGGFGENGAIRDVPHYSTDIAAAWLVVEAMHDAGWWIDIERDASGTLATMEPFEAEDLRRVELRADTSPLAICRAALSAEEATP